MRRLLGRFGTRADRHAAALEVELELLRDENMRLRLERQRLLGAAKSAQKVKELLGASGRAADDADEAWQALADTSALRDTILAVIGEVQQAMNTARQQLVAGALPTELDRRMVERRQTDRTQRARGADGDAVRPREEAPFGGASKRHLHRVVPTSAQASVNHVSRNQ